MKIRPLQDRIVVKRLASEEKTKGGILHARHGQGEAQGGAKSSPSGEGTAARQDGDRSPSCR